MKGKDAKIYSPVAALPLLCSMVQPAVTTRPFAYSTGSDQYVTICPPNVCASGQDNIFTAPYFILPSRRHGGFPWESCYGSYIFVPTSFCCCCPVVCSNGPVLSLPCSGASRLVSCPLACVRACCWLGSALVPELFLAWGLSLASSPWVLGFRLQASVLILKLQASVLCPRA